GAGFTDADYQTAGAVIVDTAEEVFATADMIGKVKEPQAVERKMLREGQLLFTYLHLAPDPDQTHDLIASGCTAIAYETVTDAHGGLPLLAPMSEVAGRLSPQVGAYTLQKANGGRGVLMGGVPGVGPANVLVIGGGVVGCSILFHLAKFGWKDVVLLERDELTSGSSWHAAGQIHTISSDPNISRLQSYTIDLYKEIEETSGHSVGLHITGGFYL
ncbi:MAG: FAD-binding oxidoreductase, partial [Pseudomonadota bacterium]